VQIRESLMVLDKIYCTTFCDLCARQT